MPYERTTHIVANEIGVKPLLILSIDSGRGSICPDCFFPYERTTHIVASGLSLCLLELEGKTQELRNCLRVHDPA